VNSETPSPLSILNTNVNYTKSKTTATASISSTTTTTTSIDPYKRKDKSLSLLCQNFIKTYSTSCPNDLISIDGAAQLLGVERRRIYDIINILEAICVVTRKCKNTYYWHGTSVLVETFHHMQQEAMLRWKDDAIQNGLLLNNPHSVNNHANDSPTVHENNGLAMLLATAEQVDKNRPYTQSIRTKPSTTSTITTSNEKDTTKDRSLGRLSQKFIQLFLVGHKVIVLTDAADKILGPVTTTVTDSRALKTKIRRLYDVANVLASIGIIEKLNGGNMIQHGSVKSRPSFRWTFHKSALEIYNHACSSTNSSSSIKFG
jgi:transcription factor E2F7/8